MSKLTKKINIVILAFIMLTAVMPLGVQAADLLDNFGLNHANNIGLKNTNPKGVIVNVIQIVLSFLALIAVIIILIGGFTWMTAGGDAEKVKTGQKYIINGAIGLLIILAAYGITNFLITTINNNVVSNT